jgi:hypothetical protein
VTPNRRKRDVLDPRWQNMNGLLAHSSKEAGCRPLGDSAIVINPDAAIVSEEDPDCLFFAHRGENVDRVFFVVALLPERK